MTNMTRTLAISIFGAFATAASLNRDDEVRNGEIENAYDNLIATRTEVPSSNTAYKTIVRDREGTVVINYR